MVSPKTYIEVTVNFQRYLGRLGERKWKEEIQLNHNLKYKNNIEKINDKTSYFENKPQNPTKIKTGLT